MFGASQGMGGRVLSQPCEVHFAGFRSDTYRLQQEGWSLSVEQDIRRGSLCLAMKFEPAGLYMMAEEMGFDFFGYAGGRERAPVFVIRHVSSHIRVQLMRSMMDFRPIDATPSYERAEFRDIEDFGIFATQQVRTEEIIVEPQSVAEALEHIKRLQAPELAAIRKRNAQRQRDPGSKDYGAMQRTNVHAQIISLAA